MTHGCDKLRGKLTAYLDGDLDPDAGTVVRGHLRTCDACREVAAAEAKLRDELRALPVLDPPPSMWEGVQARLAAAEVVESKRPGWRRTLDQVVRWTRGSGVFAPRMLVGGVAVATVALVVMWRMNRPDADAGAPTTPDVIAVPSPVLAPSQETKLGGQTVESAPFGTDVTADLAGEGQRIVASYVGTAEELMTMIGEVREQWSAGDQATYDREVAALQVKVNAATDDRTKQRELRALIRYVQRALVRDDVALAGGAP